MGLLKADGARRRSIRVRLVDRPAPPRRKRIFAVLEHLLTLAVAIGAFYLVPVTGRWWDFSTIMFWVVIGALIALVAKQLVKQAKAGSDPSVRMRTLLFLLYPIIAVFALIYYALQVHSPDEFVGITSRTDSLYFTVVTLGTVGYGDVHPVGQAAKWITMGQIVFDLVVIGLLLSIAGARMMSWAQLSVEQDAGDDDSEGGKPATVDAAPAPALPSAAETGSGGATTATG